MMAIASEARTRVTIYFDQDASNPLNDAPFGHMVRIADRSVEIDGEWVRDVNGVGARRIIHEHLRGVRIAARVDIPMSYTNRDAGDGFMYATPADVIAEYGADTPANRASALALLTARASEYRAWADGYSFGYTVERVTICPECGQEQTEDVDSCWGFTTDNPGTDLLSWMGDGMDEDGRAALAAALDNWTGDYPIAATATV